MAFLRVAASSNKLFERTRAIKPPAPLNAGVRLLKNWGQSMPSQSQDNEAAILAAFKKEIEDRLKKWERWWNFYMYTTYSLGVIGVICSTLAASELFAASAPKWFSLVSALCFAIIGFVRPEAKYRNLVRAWSELKAAKDAYLFHAIEINELLHIFRECQKIATEDDIQTTIVAPGQKSSPDVGPKVAPAQKSSLDAGP